MRFRPQISLLFLLSLFLLSSLASAAPPADDAASKEATKKSDAAKKDAPSAAKLLPGRLGEDVIAASAAASISATNADELMRRAFLITDRARRTYRIMDESTYAVELIQTRTNSAAYALLMRDAERLRSELNTPLEVLDGIGVYGFAAGGRVIYFRGNNFVSIEAVNRNARSNQGTQGNQINPSSQHNEVAASSSSAMQIARALDSVLAASTADADFPVLVRHLPDWEQAQRTAAYAVSIEGLQQAVGGQPILDGYDFGGGSEAVIASYPSTRNNDTPRLVIIEHYTPQLAADNDRFVTNRLQELHAANNPLPAYRRIGNYLVFAFNAPNQEAASELIGRVKYEQDVRWLGDNPFAQQRAERAYTLMSINILVGSLKSAGIGILLCLGVGTLFGSFIFMRRRAQSAAASSYTDAGGMVRLGIDDLTPQENAARLLSSGKK